MNAEQTYDTAVIGAGVFGAWTAYRLRESGQAVALLDGYGPANSRASSGGESRIIRMGYGADEVYTRCRRRGGRPALHRARHARFINSPPFKGR